MARPDFPRGLMEFQQRFASDAACREYLADSRWPDGYACPKCGGRAAYELETRPIYKCRTCGRQTSVTAGTVLHGSRTPLHVWFWAAYLMTTHTPGISALQLQRQLNLTRYETAWAMLQKFRRAMLRPARDRLRGTVEVDETFIGGLEPGRTGGRQRDSTKALVVGAVEARGTASGRIRLAVVPDAASASLVKFVQSAVELGSVVLSDAWQGYARLRQQYDHRPVTQGGAANGSKILPRIHRVFSNLKTWLAGTHHGVGRTHLPAYLDEFVFRFNRRGTPMAAFQSLLGLAGHYAPTTYATLYGTDKADERTTET